MKIAYIIYPEACYTGQGNGIRIQAETWFHELELRGHNVKLINPWGSYDWNSFDIIHVFSIGLWNYDIIHWGNRLNSHFVISPIIDTITPIWKYRLATYWGCKRLRLFSQNYALRKLKKDIKLFFARTEHEAKYLHEGYGISNDHIAIVPLSFRETRYDPKVPKEPFCLFVGTMTQPRKNVYRLIEAAKKYGFHLILAGNTGNKESEKQFRSIIGNAPNIDILGFVSDEELTTLYNQAKVFALPSINEGVGLVALEAAMHNCNIVITNLGGPKEYYPSGLAQLVDPYDVDDIGESVLRAMKDNDSQPRLRLHLEEKYNISICTDRLLQYYSKVIEDTNDT